jgi:hypothetical protein
VFDGIYIAGQAMYLMYACVVGHGPTYLEWNRNLDFLSSHTRCSLLSSSGAIAHHAFIKIWISFFWFSVFRQCIDRHMGYHHLSDPPVT